MTGLLHDLAAACRPVIVDGGLATELQARGHDLDDPLWSARVLLDDPDAIAAVHTAYLQAGAHVITTASYQASYEGLARRGYNRAQADTVLDRSVTLALAARDAFAANNPERTKALVAASVGPYGATRADGSEYTGEYGLTEDELVQFHGPRLARLAAHADLIACETIPSAVEVRALARVIDAVLPARPGQQAWLSVSCRNATELCHGEPVASALAPALRCPVVAAVGVNCTAPHYIGQLVAQLAAAAGERLVIAYPNAGETWDPEHRRFCGTALDPAEFAELGRRWVAAGARIVGGCCTTTPAYVAALAHMGAHVQHAR